MKNKHHNPKDNEQVILPKQWKYWCKKNNLKPYLNDFKRDQFAWFYLKGRGFVWYVNCYGEFQIEDRIGDFGRFSLCDIYKVELPKSEKEFTSSVKLLLQYCREYEKSKE